MASKEPFLPLSTSDDPENAYSMAIPTAATYTPSGPASSVGFSGSIPGGGPGSMSMSVDASGADNDFPNTSNFHTSCFNVCCDFRRAVLIVNGISIGMKILIMLGVAIGVSYVSKNLDDIEKDIDDDEVRKSVDSMFKSGKVAGFEFLFEILETVSIGLHACGIYGALTFKRWGIIVAGTTYSLQLFAGVVTMDIGNIIVSSLMLYPHIFMYKLINAGIMTGHNYHKVASCCGDTHM